MGPDLGPYYPRLHPLIAYVPPAERAPLLQTLHAMAPQELELLGRLVFSTPPSGRDALRQALIRQPGAGRLLSLIHISRRLGIARTLGQAQRRVTLRVRVVQRLQRRRRAAEHHRHGQRLGADDGEVACVVADAVELLVAAVVLFVDDDEAGLLYTSRCV